MVVILNNPYKYTVYDYNLEKVSDIINVHNKNNLGLKKKKWEENEKEENEKKGWREGTEVKCPIVSFSF